MFGKTGFQVAITNQQCDAVAIQFRPPYQFGPCAFSPALPFPTADSRYIQIMLPDTFPQFNARVAFIVSLFSKRGQLRRL
jgi:hypothetical protein